MNTSAHISLETLTDIAEQRTTDALKPALAHLSTCSACADLLSRLEQLIFMMKRDTTRDVPRDVLISAINIFSREKQSAVRRIVAILTFDSRSATPAFGMRSVHTHSRQILYSAQGTDIDLRVVVQNEECIIAGQVLRDECSGGLVRIVGEAGSAEASLNEICEFKLPAVPVGSYSIILRLPDIEIEIPQLELNG